VFRAPFDGSKMGRDALLVDLDVAWAPAKTVSGNSGGGVFRIANTHLESTMAGAMQRPKQLAIVARFLKQPGVAVGVVGGDMNALIPSEKHLPGTRGIELKDAWNIEELYVLKKNDYRGLRRSGGGVCGEEWGNTWGYQTEPKRMKQQPPGRLDKILYTGDVAFGGVAGKVVRRIGIGLQYYSAGYGEEGYGWVSDHFGLGVCVKIGGGGGHKTDTLKI
jgi:hypothetical protein